MNWLVEKMKEDGSKNAIIFKGKEYTYEALVEQIESYYIIISKQINQGEIVSVISDYSFQAIALFFALYENRNVIVPITTKINQEIDDRVRVANSDYRIEIDDNKLNVHKAIKKTENHPLVIKLQEQQHSGLILFSSGSTGAPKAMIHNLDNLVDSYKGKRGKNIVFLIFLMFDHIGGLNSLLNCLSMGVTMVFPEHREPEHVAELIEKYKVNILPASPTFLNLVLISEANLRYNMSSLRMITYGTEPMPDSLLLKLKTFFPRVKFLQTFGTSETGISQTTSKSSDSTFLKIDDPNTEIKIVRGELWIRSKTQVMGYLNSLLFMVKRILSQV